jgi:hypothetical protein
MAGILIDDIDRIVCANGLISQVWAGPALVYQYDNIKPVLKITAPVGMTAAAPTYVQSDVDIEYTVTGTVTDAESGIASVVVNDVVADIDGDVFSAKLQLATNTTHKILVVATDNAGNTNAAARYVRVAVNEAQIMSEAWTGIYGSQSMSRKMSEESTMYREVEGTGWKDDYHQLVIVLKDACIPTALKFHTPAIVNSGQSASITYKIWGSNDDWDSTPDNMAWDALVASTTIAHSQFGDVDISMPISTEKAYKYIRLQTTWFYGANDYHGVTYGSLQLWGMSTGEPVVADENVVLLTLSSDTDDADIFAVIDGTIYAVENATIDDKPTPTTYNFDII